MTAGYLFAIAISVIFMLFMDGAIGVMMLAFLLLMPLLSLALTLWVRKKITLTLKLPDTAAKQRTVSAILTLEKDTWLPLPFLRMNFRADAHFSPLNPAAQELPPRPLGLSGFRARRDSARWKRRRNTQLTPDVLPLCLSLGTDRSAEYRIALTTRFCGAGEVAVSDVRLSDFFAMFRFRMKISCEERLLVTPEIPELKASSNLFRAVSTAVAAADEESDATPAFSASSMPGYEHRDYIPGDSLKRINWKLSSKRRQLMVRKDEPVALAQLSVVLDFRRDQREISMTERLEAEEQMIETALGFLKLCTKYGYPCKLSYADEAGAWTNLSLDSPDQLAAEAAAMLRGGCRSGETLGTLSILPPELLQEAGAVLLYFTTHTGTDTAAGLERYPSTLYLLTPEQTAPAMTVPKNGTLWMITKDRNLEQAGGEL